MKDFLAEAKTTGGVRLAGVEMQGVEMGNFERFRGSRGWRGGGGAFPC